MLAVVVWMCLARAMCASLQAWYIIGGSHVTKNVGCYISVISLFVRVMKLGDARLWRKKLGAVVHREKCNGIEQS